MSPRLFRPALSSHRVTVRADTIVPRTASSWLMRRADHFDTRGTNDTGFSRYMNDGATSLDSITSR